MRALRALTVLGLLALVIVAGAGCHEGTFRDNARESRLRNQEEMVRPEPC